MRCHSPMASADAELSGAADPVKMALIGDGTEPGTLALDGVACALCRPDPAGRARHSQELHWTLRDRRCRRDVRPPRFTFTMPMVNHTGFKPVQASHVRESRLCGSCHTLETEAYNASGQPEGLVLPEQTPLSGVAKLGVQRQGGDARPQGAELPGLPRVPPTAPRASRSRRASLAEPGRLDFRP